MDKKEIVKKTEEFMKENVPQSRLTKEGSEEIYLKHVLGAREYSLYLAEKYNADKFVLEIAALLHDIGADKKKEHAKESAKIAKKFLSKFNLPNETIEKIIRCIERHSMGSETETIEEQILQDADGIIFIKDTYKFFFEKGKQNFPLEEARKYALDKTKGMLNKIKTEEGIKLAKSFLGKSLNYLKSAS